MYCGIDVAKNKSDVCILDKDKKIKAEFSITHDKEGFEELEKYLTNKTKIGMEVTGNYCKALFHYLRKKGYKVTYVDNFRMNTFAKLHSPQVKNDKVDARLISLYVASPDELNKVEIPRVDELKDLSNLYNKTVKQLTRYKCMFKDQLNIIFPELEKLTCSNGNMGLAYMLLKYPNPEAISTATDEEIRQALRENLKRAGRFDLEYARKVKKLAKESVGINGYPTTCFKHTIKTMLFYKIHLDALKKDMKEGVMKTPYSRLLNEFGYNVVGLSTIIGIVGNIRRFSDYKKFSSYCGFGVYEKKSGSSVNKSTHITKKGNGRLRHAFYMMALIHIGYKTGFSKFYFKLKEKGKHPKKCLVATARRLAVKCYWDMMKCHQ